MTRRDTVADQEIDRPRPRRAAWIAFLVLILFAAIHVYWGLGFHAGLTTFLAYEGDREAEIIASPRFKAAGLWGVALLSVIGATIAGVVLRGRDGTTVPRRAVLLVSTAAAGVLAIRGAYGMVFGPMRIVGLVAIPDDVDADWFWLDALLLAPAFFVVGTSFAVIAWDQWQRITWERSPRVR